jgi:Sigma-70, region 4
VSRLTEQERDDLVEAFACGATHGELAVAFGISERHVRRLVAGVVSAPEPLAVSTTVEAAVEEFLDGELDTASAITAEAALAVARRLDRSDVRSAANLAARLVDLVADLRWQNREPDAVDDLIRRREARRSVSRQSSELSGRLRLDEESRLEQCESE